MLSALSLLEVYGLLFFQLNKLVHMQKVEIIYVFVINTFVYAFAKIDDSLEMFENIAQN